IEARSLGDFIATKYTQPETMRQLCIAWVAMIQELERIHFAHGDLDLTNVLVLEKGPQLILKLIDYDNVWIPALAGRSNPERGHPPFQHPMFFSPDNLPRPYNAEMDRFSALSMYISIRAIGLKPQLYVDFGADETNRLLFSAEDYRKVIEAPRESRIIQLRHAGMKTVDPYLDELITALREKVPSNPPCSLATVPMPPDEIIAWDPIDKAARAARQSTGSGYTTRPSTPLPGDSLVPPPYQQPQPYQSQQLYQPYRPATKKPLLSRKAIALILALLVIAVIIAIVLIVRHNAAHASLPPIYPFMRYLTAHQSVASLALVHDVVEGVI
ncbi:MAG TPA: hypothetical protein VFQ36_00785, partial [Ktedonobacteraceae bacterium]|nr:hypothetical protein [Ktedonobacteraceae bacterium]